MQTAISVSLIAKIKAEAKFSLACEHEDIDYRGNCSAIDAETDAAAEQWIRDQLDAGNEWAWCYAKVTVEWNGLQASDGLGGCSYESEQQFREGGYYEDMVATCLDSIVTDALRIAEAANV